MSSLSRWELEEIIEDLRDRLDAEHEQRLEAEGKLEELCEQLEAERARQEGLLFLEG